MKPQIVLFVLLSLFISCESTVTTVEEIHLSAKNTTVADSCDIFHLLYADDDYLLASTSHSSTNLIRIPIKDSKLIFENCEFFLNKGRAQADIQNHAIFKCCNDTIHVLSYNSYGIDKIIRIPFDGIKDIPSWEIDNSTYYQGLFPAGLNLDVLDDGSYIFAGGKFDSEKFICFLNNKEQNFKMYDYIPDDGIDSNPMVKLLVYSGNARIFTNGNDILYICGNGCLAMILNSEDGNIRYLYDEFPIYSVAPDGINYGISPKSSLGISSFASDNAIYLSPHTEKIVNGKYVPDNFKGYPPYFVDRIEVFSWEGNGLYTLCLEYPCSSFMVDESGKRLYAKSQDLDTGDEIIYQYDLPADID